MKATTIESVKDCGQIFFHEDYVVLCGKFLWIFRTDGKFVTKGEHVRWPYKIAFLPNDKMLVDGGGFYYYLSLEDGSCRWQFPAPKGMQQFQGRFAVSPDSKIIYDMYRDRRNLPYMMEIHPEEEAYFEAPVKKGMRATEDIFCDERGTLCALESQVHREGIYKVGIREVHPNNEQEEIVWKKKWTQSVEWTPLETDGRYVLHRDLSVLDTETMERFSLWEEKGGWNPIGGIATCRYIPDRQLLVASDLDVGENLVIDCVEHRLVARYSGYTKDRRYKGCLIGDEYWIGTEEGIVRKTFPMFEDMPERVSPWWLFTGEMEKVRGEELSKKQVIAVDE